MNAETDCVFRVLWVAHEDVGVIRSRACLEALETARTAACAKWPELARFYSRLEVIWPWSDAPPDALWEAAERSVRRLEAPPIELSLRCDVAVLGALSDIEIAGLLPAFVMPPKSGEAALFDAGGADALYDDGRRAAVAPTAVSVATLVDTLFAPPRGEGEMDRLLDYLAEDPSKAARLHSYALLLKASAASAREPPGRPDPWRSALDLLPIRSYKHWRWPRCATPARARTR